MAQPDIDPNDLGGRDVGFLVPKLEAWLDENRARVSAGRRGLRPEPANRTNGCALELPIPTVDDTLWFVPLVEPFRPPPDKAQAEAMLARLRKGMFPICDTIRALAPDLTSLRVDDVTVLGLDAAGAVVGQVRMKFGLRLMRDGAGFRLRFVFWRPTPPR